MNLLQRPEVSDQRSEDRGQKTRQRPKPCDRGRTAFALSSIVRPLIRRPPLAFWLFVALFALPLFAHGCHGDDVDHEPLLAPFRLSGDDR